MALPLIAAGIALGAALLHESNKNHYKELEQKRKYFDPNREDGLIKAPSDSYDGGLLVEPVTGSVVCCEVFNFLDHTGIWIDRDTIIELSNNGLVKSVSAERFLTERSGENIFVACDHKHQPIHNIKAADRAVSQLFTYREYDLINNNCHRFVNYCLTGEDEKISRFSSLNKSLSQLSGENIYWDKAKIPF